MQKLIAGDTVDIIAPAASFPVEDIDQVAKLLTDWNLTPHIPTDILGTDLLCANSDEKRFTQLKDALLNTESRAVWCIKGGYGCARLIPELEKLPVPKHSKLFIGFSDITVLNIFLQQKWGWQPWHGPGARQLPRELIDVASIQEFKNILFGEQKNIQFQLTPLNEAAKQDGLLNAVVTGGTLSVIQTGLATSWHIDTKSKILFLEDVNERGYKVDRMLQHLKQVGIFSEVKAVLFGDFIGGAEPKGISLIEEVIERFAQENHFPVLRCPGIGHGKQNRVLPFGVVADLKLGEHGILKINLTQCR